MTMTQQPEAPPEAQLIARLREAPPRMSIKKAAAAAGISDTRWRQIEHGWRPAGGGQHVPEKGPSPTVAQMAYVVGATPAQLAEAGRADAAGELQAILDALDGAAPFTGRQKSALAKRITRDLG